MTDEEHCLCSVAAPHGIFCRGFERLSDGELRQRFGWIARKRPEATRAELEEPICLYHPGREEIRGEALCCDVETREHAACDGWNQFDNSAIEKFVPGVVGQRISIG